MAELPLSMMPHKARLQPYTGTGAYGDSWGPEVERPCWIDETRRLVRAADGSEKVAEATLLLPLDARGQALPGSLVKLHTEIEGPYRESQVLTASLRTDGGMGAWQHLEVTVA